MYKVEMSGFTMLLHGDNYLEEKIVKTGCWEPATTRVFRELVKPGMSIVDVGANIGYFSLLSASLVGPQGEVHAFEPYPGYRERFEQSLKCNCFGQIRINPFALSDKVERHQLYKGLASARMQKWTHDDPVFQEIHDQVEVQCVRLDDYAKDNLKQIDLIKIDVDGHEMQVLRGAAECLKRDKPIVIIELYEDALRDAGASVQQLLDYFEQLEYLPFSEQGQRFDYQELILEATGNPGVSINVVFRPKTKKIMSSLPASMPAIKKPCSSGSMKILFLSVNFEGWVAPTVYYEQQAILKQLPDSVIYGPGFDYETNLVPEIVRKYFGNDRPDVIFCYVDERRLTGMPLPDAVCQKYGLTGPMRVFPTGLDKIKDIPKIAWINDFWHCGRQDWDRILLGNGFDYAFSTYCPPFVRREVFDSFFSRQVQERVRFIPWPRSINPEIFRDDGLERIHDVTLLGAVNPVFYPLRTKMHQVFSQQPGLQYFHQQHPGYQYFSDNQVLTGQRYAQCLQQSKLFASCTGKYHIPFIKLYEALASGAGLLCDIPQGGEYLGLKPFENYLPVTMDNFLETARSYLLDAPMLQDIAQNGRSLFEQKHTVDIRADEFVSILNAIVDGRSPGHWAELSPVSHESVTVSIATPTDKTRDLMKPTQSYHITEIARVTNPSVYAIWYQYGSNQRPHENPPVVTAFPELVMLRGVLLRQLAEQLGAKTFAEVGTARGFQSFMWARYLVEKGIDDGRIFTCDITPHDQRYYKTPMSRNLIFTRRELWNGTPESSRVCFIDGDSSVMAQAIDRPVDMVYIDGMHDEPSVRSDFENLKRFLHPHSVIVFDDCDERFVGIQKAVLDICSEMGAGFQAVEFTPSAYKIAIVQVEATHLDRIRTQDAGHGPNSLTRQKISIEQPRI